jgi:hypothetical protein
MHDIVNILEQDDSATNPQKFLLGWWIISTCLNSNVANSALLMYSTLFFQI